jgi:hypothetical protein
MKAVFSPPPCINAPHSVKTTAPDGIACFAELSKRELDFVLFFLLPCGAKPSALAYYKNTLL